MVYEISRVTVKNAEEFFEGFYPPVAVQQNSYKLRRMLDFGQAFSGDYLVLRIDGKSVASLEIIRSNSRRFWENGLRIAKDCSAEFITENISAVIEAFIDYLFENKEYIVPMLPLWFVVDDQYPYSAQLKQALVKRKYQLHSSNLQVLLPVNMPQLQENLESTIELRPFIELSVEQRIVLVAEYELADLPQIKAESLYQDYLETGEKSEILWQAIICNQRIAGYFMFCQQDLLTSPNAILFNYRFSETLTAGEQGRAIALMLQYIDSQNQPLEITITVAQLQSAHLNIWQQILPGLNIISNNETYLES